MVNKIKELSSFSYIGAYYALTYIFFYWKIESFLKDILVAPLFFLVPTGIGLLVFSFLGTHRKLLQFITKLQLSLCASFLGFLLISLIYVHLDNNDKLPGAFFLLYPAINLLSLFGFYNTRNILQPGDKFKDHLITLAKLLPLFLVVYYFYFIHFSSFPLRDIFMEAHFMKGALEFSRYYILNIATGDSYFALYQVHLGVLNHFYASDLINLHWILPFFLFLFQYFCYDCFYSSFINKKFVLYIALGLSVLCTSLMFTTNNGYLLLLSLILFSVLVRKNKKQTKCIPVVIELLGLGVVSIISYLNGLTLLHGEKLLPYLILYLLFMALFALLDFKKLLSLTFVGLLLLIANPYHKVASLYIPLVLLIYGIYFISFQWDVINYLQFKKLILKKLFLFVIICPVVCVLLGLFILKNWPFVDIHIRNLFYSIYLYLGGDGSYSPAGIKGLLAEWLRTVPLELHLVFLFLILAMLVSLRQGLSDYIFTKSNMNFLIFCSISTVLSMIIFFIPIPHIYRVLFFPSLMIFAMIAFLFEFYYSEYVIRKNGIFAVIMLPALILTYSLIARFVYWLPWKNGQLRNHYISLLSPISEIIILLMMLFSLLALLAFLGLKRKPIIYISFCVIFMSGTVLDRFMIISKLYENSHPYAPYTSSPPRVISHYSLIELKSAEWLNKYIQSPEFILISDPYTLGIFEAVTGNNGFYTFSNLGLMREEFKNNMKEIFRNIFPNLEEANNDNKKYAEGKNKAKLYGKISKDVINFNVKNEYIIESLYEYTIKNRGAFPEMEYALLTRWGIPLDPRLWKEKIIFVITEKTINWAYGEVGYYPQNRPFDEDYINNYILPYFDILKNAENKVLILRLK